MVNHHGADAATAEVFLHGCCSSLDKTPHHLGDSSPPTLVTRSNFKAEIMTQTMRNQNVKTRSVKEIGTVGGALH